MTSTRKGAPRKVHTQSSFPREIHTTVRNWVYELLPSGLNVNEAIEPLIIAAYGEKAERELSVQREKVQKMEIDLARERVILSELEEKKRQKDIVQEKMRTQQKYMAFAFREIAKMSRAAREITIRSEWIVKSYGISFNRTKANREIFRHGELNREMLDLPDADLIERYGIAKELKGDREQELLARMKESGPE